jgi:small subunit ribosomal protein S4
MKIGPKFKIGKRLGASVFEKCQTQKFQLSLARTEKTKGKRRGGARSDFGKQFLEKQKVRYTYGISEKQFKNYVDKANTMGKNPTDALFQLLETRLDNVVYRLGLAPTRRAARQMVSHGHILVDNRKVTIPSFTTKKENIIGIRGGSQSSKLFSELEEKLKDRTTIPWVSFDASKKVGKVSELPTYKKDENAFDLTPVLEFYSR